MHNKYLYLFILSFTLKFNIYSQKNDNSTRNDIIKFLYEKKEISDKDLAFLLNNNKNELNILVHIQELNLNCDNLGLSIFKFGIASEHSKEYLLLLKGKNEKLFLGVDFKNELEQNSFFNFIKFYKPEVMITLYQKIFCDIIVKLYKHNNDIANEKTIKLIEVYKD